MLLQAAAQVTAVAQIQCCRGHGTGQQLQLQFELPFAASVALKRKEKKKKKEKIEYLKLGMQAPIGHKPHHSLVPFIHTVCCFAPEGI